MPLVTTYDMLNKAQSLGVAVGAFNIENMEMAQAVIAAAEETQCPVILQTTPSTLRYGGTKLFVNIASALAQSANVSVAIHLDHGNSLDLCCKALEDGYTSIMYDGSSHIFEENAEVTKKAVELAAKRGIPVEAELGSVGGKEDDLETENAYTDPQMAAEFVALTGASSLAVAIGTAHGIYKGTPVLDMKRLVEIRKKVSVPLVLHGASGLTKDAVQNCIREGICKVNFATELRIAYSDGVKAYLKKHPDAYDPKTYGRYGFERVKNLTIEKIAMCMMEDIRKWEQSKM